MYTLGIESSCDETSCAVLKDYRVLSNVTISSLRKHVPFGGVVPEIATRAHLKNIDIVAKEALRQAKVPLKKIGLVAATAKPGLMGALVVGLNFAQSLALALNKPFVGVNHLHAHLFAPFLNNSAPLKFPFLGVVVSGGHTDLYRVDDFDSFKQLGNTLDDACGEVYDKVARAFGLPYPGGPVIDKLFDEGQAKAFSFKCGRIGYDLSFSGIKTALVYKAKELEAGKGLDQKTKVALISSFQFSVVQTLVQTIVDAAIQEGLPDVVCGGGVIANSYLRQQLKARESAGLRFFLSESGYATDNAAIVAGLGFYLYNKGIESPLSLQAEAN